MIPWLSCLLAVASVPLANSGLIAFGVASDTTYTIVFETTHGDFTLEVYSARAPRTVEAFMSLVRSGFYDDMVFHRVVRDRVVQTGWLDPDFSPREHTIEPLPNEADNRLKNVRGSVAMARLRDPHSATTEFFVNVEDNPHLDFKSYTVDDWGFTVFGRVIDGMRTVDAISRVPTKRVGRLRDVPRDFIIIHRAYVRD